MSGKTGKTLLSIALFAAACVFSTAYSGMASANNSVACLFQPSSRSTACILEARLSVQSQPRDADTYDKTSRHAPASLVLFSESPTNWGRIISGIRDGFHALSLANPLSLPDFPILRVYNEQLTDLAGPRQPSVFRAAPRSPPV